MVGCVWAVAGPAIMTTAAEARRRCRRIGNSQKLDGSSVLIARPYDKNQLVKDKLAPEWGDFQTLDARFRRLRRLDPFSRWEKVARRAG
ncbi:hypothetical protein D3C72_1465070 [compost metagenome]